MRRTVRSAAILLCIWVAGTAHAQPTGAPVPLLRAGQPVDWWFMFKFNSGVFPGCGGDAERICLFDKAGRAPQDYSTPYGQQFVYASSADHSLQKGSGCAGDSVNDPLGATFDEVYNGNFHYLIWNDQFYDDPKITGCTNSCGAPWGHSKGLLAWDDAGDGLVLQVTTPSWPASGNAAAPRLTDGNSLGCVKDDNVLVSQHFFALRLTKDDVVKVLQALQNASVVSKPNDRQIVGNGGPADIQALVSGLGKKSTSTSYIETTLSSGVVLISKPSRLNVPPWQLVSALLQEPLRAATWWTTPQIYTTDTNSKLTCWPNSLARDRRALHPQPVEIALSGQWLGNVFGLAGGPGANKNHAKVGVSTGGGHGYAIFGDMNQQGASLGRRKCSSSQNGRGGLFYVIDDTDLHDSVAQLIEGETAPLDPAEGR